MSAMVGRDAALRVLCALLAARAAGDVSPEQDDVDVQRAIRIGLAFDAAWNTHAHAHTATAGNA